MPYAIDLQKTLDLVGGSAEYDYDVGAHSPSRTVYVARSVGGPVRLGTWSLGNDGTFSSGGNETVVGHGSRTRIVVFDNQRFVVFWLDNASALRARGFAFSGSALIEGAAHTVAAAIASFDVVPVGVTTGVQHGGSGVAVYYNYRQFASRCWARTGLEARVRCGDRFRRCVDRPGRPRRYGRQGRPVMRQPERKRARARIRARRSRSGATPARSRRRAGASPMPA